MHFSAPALRVGIDIAKREMQVIHKGDQTLKCGNHAYFHLTDIPEGGELARTIARLIGYRDIVEEKRILYFDKILHLTVSADI